MKHIDAAMQSLKTKTAANDHDLSLVERILANEPDPKTAYVLALDLILVGIDTVRFEPNNGYQNSNYAWLFQLP